MEQDIFGLDVAVNHSPPMRVVERIGDVAGDPDRFVDTELSLAIQFVAEGLPVDEGHHVIEEPIGGAGIEEREDVRVLETRRGLDLLHEALGAQHRGQLWLQHLERDPAIVLEILRQVDGRHAARAEMTLDPVGAREGGVEAIGWGGHRPQRCYEPPGTARGTPISVTAT